MPGAARVSCENLNQLYNKKRDLENIEDPENDGLLGGQNNIAVFWYCNEEKEKVNADAVK